MTTIAYRDGVMASDSGAWYGDASHGWAKKLARGRDGTLYGTAGNAALCDAFLKWVRDGEVGEYPQPTQDKDGNGTFVALRVRPGALVELITWSGVESYEAPYFAIGSGVEVAFGALFMGASPEQAIEAAKEHGSGAFGAVQVIRAVALTAEEEAAT